MMSFIHCLFWWKIGVFQQTVVRVYYILKAIVNLLSYGENRILILYENNHYITPYKKNCFFLNSEAATKVVLYLDPGPHTFFHWIKTSGVKVRPVLEKSYLLHEQEGIMKSRYCENSYNLRK